MEHYVTITSHPNYEVSDLGNVRNKKTGTIRKLTDRKGYRKVRLNNQDESVHRLVAEAFYEGNHDGLQVNHKDGNKANNRVDNLEWVTSSENVKHAFDHGLKQPAGGCPPTRVFDESTDTYYSSIADCARNINGTRAGIVYSMKQNKSYKGHRITAVGE